MPGKRFKAKEIVNELRQTDVEFARGSTVAEARVLIERWREHYNRVHPHSAPGYRPPAPEAIAAGPPSASLRAVQQRLSDRTTTAWTVDSTAGEGQYRAVIVRRLARRRGAHLEVEAAECSSNCPRRTPGVQHQRRHAAPSVACCRSAQISLPNPWQNLESSSFSFPQDRHLIMTTFSARTPRLKFASSAASLTMPPAMRL